MSDSQLKNSQSQIDRLGDRLRNGVLTEVDLRLLDQYRRSFQDSYEHVITTLRENLYLSPTGRPAKSTAAIRDKLKRESARLTQVQDIAGCRVVVENIAEQDAVVEKLKPFFPSITIVDRRIKPSNGYRAVHVIIKHLGKLVELQVRTKLQHRWAELSEKLSDYFGLDVKYGGGPESALSILKRASNLVSRHEDNEAKYKLAESMFPANDPNKAMRMALEKLFEELIQQLSNE